VKLFSSTIVLEFINSSKFDICPLQSQPCHWRSALGRKKRDLPELPEAASSASLKNKKVTNIKSSYYPGFFRKSRFTDNGEEIEVDDNLLSQAGGNTANVTTISLFQALQVLKDVSEEGAEEEQQEQGDKGGKTDKSAIQQGGKHTCSRSHKKVLYHITEMLCPYLIITVFSAKI
jgi:hypothetical protein